MDTFSDLFRYVRIYQRYLGRRMYLVFVLAVSAALAEGLGITMLLPLLRATQVGKTEDMGRLEQMLHDGLGQVGLADSMVGILGAILLIFVVKGLLQFAFKGYQGHLQSDLLRELKMKLFDGYTGMDYRYYIRNNTGHFINIINQQVNRLFKSFASFVGFFSQITRTLSYFAFAFAVAWRFSLMVVGIGAGLLYLFKYLNSYVRRLSRQRAEEMSHLNKLLVQSLQAMKYIVATNQTSHVRFSVKESVKRLTDYIFWQRIATAFTAAVQQPVSVLLIVVVITIQVTILNEPITPIFVAILLFHRGIQSTMSIQSGWQATMDRIGSVEMVDDELNAVLQNQESRAGRSIGAIDDGIELQNVHYAYNSEDGDVLRNIDLQIPANSTIALVGESGAGKSTLVDMLTLMLRPRRGEIRVDGIPHDEIDVNSWRDQIGYVSQETVVFDDTVANNIHLWRGDIEEDPALRERVRDAARRAHADGFIQDLTNGYQTMVGDRGVRLSGGQRQRLFVARELFKRPNLLLLDEATSDLDTASEQHIQNSIDALHGEVTVVIIAHRLSTVKNADCVYVLDEGSVIERGTYHELCARTDGEFREMVEMQSL